MLRSGSVVLRPPRIEDAEAIRAAGRQADLARMYGVEIDHDEPIPEHEARRRVEWLAQESHAWTIEHEGRAVGIVRFHGVNGPDGWLAVGLFSRDDLNQGIGTDAIRAALDYAAGPPLHLERAWVRVLEYNERAIRAYGKCGFRPVRREENAVEIAGRMWADEILCAELG